MVQTKQESKAYKEEYEKYKDEMNNQGLAIFIKNIDDYPPLDISLVNTIQQRSSSPTKNNPVEELIQNFQVQNLLKKTSNDIAIEKNKNNSIESTNLKIENNKKTKSSVIANPSNTLGVQDDMAKKMNQIITITSIK